MKLKKVEAWYFRCPSCRTRLHKIKGPEWGCMNQKCFNAYSQMEYRVKLGLIPKNRL